MILLIKQSSVVAQKLRTSHKECSTSKKLLMPNHARIPILFVKIDGMPRHGLAAARRHAVRPKFQTAPIPRFCALCHYKISRPMASDLTFLDWLCCCSQPYCYIL